VSRRSPSVRRRARRPAPRGTCATPSAATDDHGANSEWRIANSKTAPTGPTRDPRRSGTSTRYSLLAIRYSPIPPLPRFHR
jgi:hypothetical protein